MRTNTTGSSPAAALSDDKKTAELLEMRVLGRGSGIPTMPDRRRRNGRGSITQLLRALQVGDFIDIEIELPEVECARGATLQSKRIHNRIQYLQNTHSDRRYCLRRRPGVWRVYRVAVSEGRE